METWMISLLIAVVGFISGYAVMKHKTKDHAIRLEKLEKRIDAHYKTLITLQETIKTRPTMENMRETFVEIEMWKLSNEHLKEKLEELTEHIDDRFDDIIKLLK